jgi:hypothetical protein
MADQPKQLGEKAQDQADLAFLVEPSNATAKRLNIAAAAVAMRRVVTAAAEFSGLPLRVLRSVPDGGYFGVPGSAVVAWC